MNKLILLFSLILVPISAQDSFELEIIMPKNVFITGEPVEIGICIKNLVNKIYYVDSIPYVNIEINNSKNHKQSYNKSFGGGNYYFYSKLLMPNEEDYIIVDLNAGFGKLHKGYTWSTYFEPEIYTVTISLILKPNTLLQKTINFTIEEPEDDEKFVYDEFKQIIMTTGTEEYRHINFINKLTSLITIYPNSVYVPDVLQMLSTWYRNWIRDFEKSHKYSKKLIENYTWSLKAQGLINLELKKLSTKSERVDFLNSLKINTINSVMEKFIEIKLHNETINNSD